MDTIKVPFGSSVRHVFSFENIDCDAEKDAALFVIRDKEDNVLLWKMLTPEYDSVNKQWSFILDIPHKEFEAIPKGSYKYGLSLYKNCVYRSPELDVEPIEPEEPGTNEEEPELTGFSQYLLDDDLTEFEPEESEIKIPDDGEVYVLINRKSFVVLESVAREDGINA